MCLTKIITYMDSDPFFKDWRCWNFDDLKRKRLVVGVAQHLVFVDAQRSQSSIIWDRFALLTSRLNLIDKLILVHTMRK